MLFSSEAKDSGPLIVLDFFTESRLKIQISNVELNCV